MKIGQEIFVVELLWPESNAPRYGLTHRRVVSFDDEAVCLMHPEHKTIGFLGRSDVYETIEEGDLQVRRLNLDFFF